MPIPYFKQQKIYWCGAAAVQMALGARGYNFSQATVAKRLKTNRLLGTLRVMIVRELRKTKIPVKVVAHGTLEQLTRYLPAIVSYQEVEGEDHYALIIGITKTHVIMHDPWHGSDYTLTTHAFLDRWKNTKRKKKYTGWFASMR